MARQRELRSVSHVLTGARVGLHVDRHAQGNAIISDGWHSHLHGLLLWLLRCLHSTTKASRFPLQDVKQNANLVMTHSSPGSDAYFTGVEIMLLCLTSIAGGEQAPDCCTDSVAPAEPLHMMGMPNFPYINSTQHLGTASPLWTAEKVKQH